MYVIRGAVDAMPYYAGYTNTIGGIVWHWTSDKQSAQRFTSWIVAIIVKDRLLREGVTSHASVEKA